MYDIVVAKYKENLDWIVDLYKANQDSIRTIYIYDKCPPLQTDLPSIPVIYEERKNIGREGESFLYHIITHWDDLGDTVFLQGHPFDHLFVTNAAVSLPLRIDHLQGFCQTKMITEVYTNNLRQCPYGLPVYFKLHDYFELDSNYAVQVSFIAGAQYIVPQQCIYFRSKAFYETLLQEMHNLQTDNQTTWTELYTYGSNNVHNVLDAWTLERLWPYIFGPTRARM